MGAYYILLPDDDIESAFHDPNLLGEDNNFGVFWAGTGFEVLISLSTKNPELLSAVRILTDKGDKIDIDTFLDKIKNLKVRRQL